MSCELLSFLSRRLLVVSVVAMLVPFFGFAQSHSGFPVDIVAGPAPQPVNADGRTRLLYELHLTNFAPLPVELTNLEILGDGAGILASYQGKALEKMVIPVEELSSADSPSQYKSKTTIGEGHAAMIFVDLSLDAGTHVPAELRHRFSFSVVRKNGEKLERTLEGVVVSVVPEPAPVLRPPLHGSAWVAFNALGAEDHRRSLNAFDGKERIPQRFAIDWVRLGDDGSLVHGDDKSNANFYGYGAEVLAVADGRISDLKDGLPQNAGTTERNARDITIDNALGNYVILDIGHGRFAVYAHLQPGSLKVKVGDQVKAGAVLALLGNSGNSDAPHLHFQLVDANSAMGSEGIPYEFESYTQLGVVPDDPVAQNSNGVMLPKAQQKPVVHRREFPMDNAAVAFP